MRFLAFSSVLLVMATLASPKPRANHPLDYEGKRGALVWGKLDPAFKVCSQGHQQSPIDIRALA